MSMIEDLDLKSENPKRELFSLKPIGKAYSCYPDKFGTPRQTGLVPSARARIKVYPEFQPELSLRGLQEFSYVWILYWFDRNEKGTFSATVRPPRGHGQSWGIFATRSPHRPNPIGLSPVLLERVDRNNLWVSGIDFVDGTPILDIKPYLSGVDRLDPEKEGWVERAEDQRLWVQWTESGRQSLESLVAAEDQYMLKKLITETLNEDPRPFSQRNKKRYGAFFIEKWNVRFFVEGQQVWVEKIELR
jgi:tRNA-Thr(GGU) m(6)t(6)A37 methyltransferase TsaA